MLWKPRQGVSAKEGGFPGDVVAIWRLSKNSMREERGVASGLEETRSGSPVWGTVRDKAKRKRDGDSR